MTKTTTWTRTGRSFAATAVAAALIATPAGLHAQEDDPWIWLEEVEGDRAMEWVMSGRVFPAAEALEGGLVSRVVPADELLPAARALAREWGRDGREVCEAFGVDVDGRHRLLKMGHFAGADDGRGDAGFV